MSVRPPLEGVLFDLDDTLHDDSLTYRRAASDVARFAAARTGADPARLLDAYIARADEFWINLKAEHLGTNLAGLRARMWHAALRDAGYDDLALGEECGVAYNAYRKRYLAPWPGALALLESLRAKGMKLGLITNGFAETHREKIELLQLGEAFDEILIADEVGMLKPDPRIFELACERLGIAPAAAAMVGDRYHRDVAGAQAAGLFAVYLRVRDENLSADARKPDAIVLRIEDVEGVLPPLRNA